MTKSDDPTIRDADGLRGLGGCSVLMYLNFVCLFSLEKRERESSPRDEQ